MNIDDRIEYATRRGECFPLNVGPGGPYRSIFNLWFPKINSVKEEVMNLPKPTFWDLTYAICAKKLFLTEIEKDAWVKIMNDLCEFFNVSNTDLIPIKIT